MQWCSAPALAAMNRARARERRHEDAGRRGAARRVSTHARARPVPSTHIAARGTDSDAAAGLQLLSRAAR